ncbi:MAG: tetratricopeptide repeat protein [Bacteroidota bacterium]
MSAKKKKKKAIAREQAKIATAKSSRSAIGSRMNLYLALFVALAAFLLYANTLSHDYAYDDVSAITENYLVKQGLEGIPEILTTNYRYGFWNSDGVLYRPLSLVLFAIQWEIAPDNPGLAHATNVLLYAATGFLLFLLLARILKDYHILLPFLASLLYIAHPVHTEIVANIKSVDEILAFLFSLGAIWQMWTYFESRRKVSLGMSLLFYLLALLSKESVLSYVAIFPLFVYFFGRPSWIKEWKTLALYALPVLLYWSIRSVVLGGAETYVGQTSVLDNFLVGAPDFLAQKASAFLMMGLYVWKLILPHPLVSDMGFNQIPLTSWADWRVWLSFLTYAAAFAYAVYDFKRKSLPAFAILFYLLTFFLFSNLVVNIGSSYGERFLYISSLGFAIGLAWGLIRLFDSPLKSKAVESLGAIWSTHQLPVIVGLLLFVGYAGKTMLRNPAWANSYTLHSTDALRSPNSAKLRYHHGMEIMKTGLKQVKKDQAGWFQRAMTEFDAALNIYPDYHDAYGQKGLALFRLGRSDEALRNYELSIKYKPTNATVYSNMGIIYMGQNNLSKAQEVYEKAVELDPRFVDARRNLGSVYAMQRQFDKAIEQFGEGLKYKPESAILNLYLGSAYRDSGRPDQARPYLERAYQLDPKLKR